jgi:hypothetical protein
MKMKKVAGKLLPTLLAVVLVTGCTVMNSEEDGAGQRQPVSDEYTVDVPGETEREVTISSLSEDVIITNDKSADNVRATNGAIRIEKDAVIGNVRSLNGEIYIEGGRVAGNVNTVNGDIYSVSGGHIQGELIAVNGSIELSRFIVDGTLKTTNGDVELTDVVLHQDLIVEHVPRFPFNWTFSRPKIYVGANSRIHGRLIARRRIELCIHPSAHVAVIEGASLSENCER